MQSIQSTIGIGTVSSGLHVEATIDGEVVWDAPGHSLVSNFLQYLFAAMGKGGNEILTRFAFFENIHDFYVEGITNVTNTNGQPLVITLDDDEIYQYFNTVDKRAVRRLVIGGIGDSSHPLSGIHQVTAATDLGSTSQLTLATLGDGVALAADDEPSAYMSINTVPDTATGFDYVTLLVGMDPRDSSINDFDLYNPVNLKSGEPYSVSISALSISALGYGETENEIVFSRDFTNNGTNLIPIREIGLFGAFNTSSTNRYMGMLSRDTISIDLDVGKTVTINYRLRTSVAEDGSGGFTNLMLELLRIHFQRVSAKQHVNITGATSTLNGTNGWSFLAAGPAGGNRHGNSDQFVYGQNIGVVVGTGTNDVETTDYALQARIAHGEGSGQLIHYGTLVDNYRVEGNEALFDVVRLFENASGASITINETGLYVLFRDSSTLFCLARHRLETPSIVADGEIIRVTYTFKLTVGA